MKDEFHEPDCYNRFNLTKRSIPDFMRLDDFTIYNTSVKERERLPMPVKTASGFGFEYTTVTILDERPPAILHDIKDNGVYLDAAGIGYNLPNIHLQINHFHPKLWWVGARSRPSIFQTAEEVTRGWWWIFHVRNPYKEWPLDHVQGGYMFEREDDAILFRAALLSDERLID